MNTPAPFQFLGVNIHPMTRYELFDRVASWIRRGGKYEIGYVNVHCINLALKDREYRSILNCIDIVYCDGFGVLFGAKTLGYQIPERMTGADWIYDLASYCEKNSHSLYFLGGHPGIAEAAAEKLKLLFSKVSILGTHHGFFDKDKCRDLVKEINYLRPDILLIGFGSPLQEKWMRKYRSMLETPVCWVVGAVFDFVSNKAKRGPKWMTDHGLEWACRFYYEPRRLWQRYLLGNMRFMYHVLKQKFSRWCFKRNGCPTDGC